MVLFAKVIISELLGSFGDNELSLDLKVFRSLSQSEPSFIIFHHLSTSFIIFPHFSTSFFLFIFPSFNATNHQGPECLDGACGWLASRKHAVIYSDDRAATQGIPTPSLLKHFERQRFLAADGVCIPTSNLAVSLFFL